MPQMDRLNIKVQICQQTRHAENRHLIQKNTPSSSISTATAAVAATAAAATTTAAAAALSNFHLDSSPKTLSNSVGWNASAASTAALWNPSSPPMLESEAATPSPQNLDTQTCHGER